MNAMIFMRGEMNFIDNRDYRRREKVICYVGNRSRSNKRRVCYGRE